MNNYKIGEKDTRSWGTWEVIDAGDSFCLKRLKLYPNQHISKQRHQFRSETWIITFGSGRVLIDDAWYDACEGDVFNIPGKIVHQLVSHDNGLTVIELQKGSILDESDIERF